MDSCATQSRVPFTSALMPGTSLGTSLGSSISSRVELAFSLSLFHLGLFFFLITPVITQLVVESKDSIQESTRQTAQRSEPE